MPALADITFINGETKIPEILIGYLNSRREEDGIELPNEATLPVVSWLRETGEELTLPCVIISVESGKQLTDDIEDYQVSVVMKNHTTGDAQEIVSLATESEWLAKLRYLLSCRAELMEYIAAIVPAEQFRLSTARITGIAVMVDEQTKVRERVTEMHVRFRSYEFTTN